MKLLVFGNGFDLWLGLPTKFSNYKKFLEKTKKYPNCYKLLCHIANANKDYEWNKLEDDMCKYFINMSCNNEPLISNVDYKNACDEKYISLKYWIEDIRAKYKKELEDLYSWLKNQCESKNIFIWSFNYIFTYYDHNNLIYTHLINGSKYQKRMVTQLHRIEMVNNVTCFAFGADNQYISKNIFCQIDDEKYKYLRRFCTKFYFFPINNNEAWPDMITEPKQWCYHDGLGLPCDLWLKYGLKEIYFLGFGFGTQDERYFLNDDKFNPFKYCNINYTYLKETEKSIIEFKIHEYQKCCESTHVIKAFRMDELLKDIFGNDGYNELLKIKSNIEQI